MQMAPVGVARLADGAYPLAGVDAVARVERRRLGEVHVDIVDAGAVSIDDDVVACQAVVALELHASAAGGHHRRATTGHHVLTLVGVPSPPGAEASGRLAVVVPPPDGELMIEEVEGIAGEIADLGTAGDGPGASRDGQPEGVAPRWRGHPGDRAVPHDALHGARRGTGRVPGLYYRAVACPDELHARQGRQPSDPIGEDDGASRAEEGARPAGAR